MFIQWRSHRAKDGTSSIRLYVRSSQRVEGKVKSFSHGYLGSYRVDRISSLAEVRKLWSQIDAAFERIDDEAVKREREKLEAQIAEKIPRAALSAIAPPSPGKEITLSCDCSGGIP